MLNPGAAYYHELAGKTHPAEVATALQTPLLQGQRLALRKPATRHLLEVSISNPEKHFAHFRVALLEVLNPAFVLLDHTTRRALAGGDYQQQAQEWEQQGRAGTSSVFSPICRTLLPKSKPHTGKLFNFRVQIIDPSYFESEAIAAIGGKATIVRLPFTLIAQGSSTPRNWEREVPGAICSRTSRKNGPIGYYTISALGMTHGRYFSSQPEYEPESPL